MPTLTANPAATTMAALAGKYLTFILAGEAYGVPVLQVREIVRLPDIRTVPGLPPHVRGVINLRGKIIAVSDLRLRFGFPAAAHTDQTCIIIVQVRLAQGRPFVVGLIVDGVEEVLNIAAADIEETPNFGAQTEYVLGMAKVKGVVKALLDIDRIVAGEAVLGPLPVLPPRS